MTDREGLMPYNSMRLSCFDFVCADAMSCATEEFLSRSTSTNPPEGVVLVNIPNGGRTAKKKKNRNPARRHRRRSESVAGLRGPLRSLQRTKRFHRRTISRSSSHSIHENASSFCSPCPSLSAASLAASPVYYGVSPTNASPDVFSSRTVSTAEGWDDVDYQPSDPECGALLAGVGENISFDFSGTMAEAEEGMPLMCDDDTWNPLDDCSTDIAPPASASPECSAITKRDRQPRSRSTSPLLPLPDAFSPRGRSDAAGEAAAADNSPLCRVDSPPPLTAPSEWLERLLLFRSRENDDSREEEELCPIQSAQPRVSQNLSLHSTSLLPFGRWASQHQASRYIPATTWTCDVGEEGQLHQHLTAKDRLTLRMRQAVMKEDAHRHLWIYEKMSRSECKVLR